MVPDIAAIIDALRTSGQKNAWQSRFAAVIRSNDGGESWTDLSQALIDLSEKPHLKSKIVSNTYNEGMLDSHAIAISPTRPTRRRITGPPVAGSAPGSQA